MKRPIPSTSAASPNTTPRIIIRISDGLNAPPRSATRAHRRGRGASLFDPERGGDARPQFGRNLFVTLGDDDPAQLDLEGEALRTRRTLVEVAGDGPALPDGQLAVEVLVDAIDRAVAIHDLYPPIVAGSRGRRLLRSA